MLPATFLTLALSAYRNEVETDLETIIASLACSPDVSRLEKLALLERALDEAELELRPSFSEGSMTSVRLLRRKSAAEGRLAMAQAEIASGEASRCEFKASFFFNWDRFRVDPNCKREGLRSDGVTESALKTIAAFLNVEGGVLYVGVRDDRKIVGLSKDFWVISSSGADGWQLAIRDLIKTRFWQGDQINNYVTIDLVEDAGEVFGRFAVTRRGRLSLLKVGDRYRLYCRQGNRTIELGMEAIEEFIEDRSINTHE